MQNGPIGKSQSVAQRPQIERLLLWVNKVGGRSAAPRSMMTGYRPADTVRAPTGTSAPVIERSPSAGDRKQRATSGRGTVPTIVDRTLRRQAADDTVVSLRAIGSYVASNFPMFSESSAGELGDMRLVRAQA